MAKITRPSTIRCRSALITFTALLLKRLALRLYLLRLLSVYRFSQPVDQTPVVAISQINKPEKNRKNTAVTTMIGNRQPLSLIGSGRARVFSTMSITE